MKDQGKQQDQKITQSGEVELTEEELDQVAGGWTWGTNKIENVSEKLKGDVWVKESVRSISDSAISGHDVSNISKKK